MRDTIKITAVGKYDVGTVFKVKHRYEKEYSEFIVIETEPSDWSEDAVNIVAEKLKWK